MSALFMMNYLGDWRHGYMHMDGIRLDCNIEKLEFGVSYIYWWIGIIWHSYLRILISCVVQSYLYGWGVNQRFMCGECNVRCTRKRQTAAAPMNNSLLGVVVLLSFPNLPINVSFSMLQSNLIPSIWWISRSVITYPGFVLIVSNFSILHCILDCIKAADNSQAYHAREFGGLVDILVLFLTITV
jgi:hypothetical protein